MPRWLRDPCLPGLIAVALIPAAEAQYVQQGIALVGSGGSGFEGSAVALSADGNTALVGAWADGFGLHSPPTGATWVFTRSAGVWTQQGAKLGGDLNGPRSAQGSSVGLSADGNTAIVGGPVNNLPCFFPAPPSGGAWIYARSGGVWNQPGSQLTAAGPVTGAVAISGDGSTAIVGGFDSTVAGAAWIFTRVNGVWTQQGNELVGAGAAGQRGFSCEGLPTPVGAVALSADGSTAIVGAPADNGYAGAVWIFTRTGATWSQQGGKLVGSGAAGAADQGISVALSGDGNTAVAGGPGDSGGSGAAWVFTRTGGVWSQQGAKLVGGGAAGPAGFGGAVAISGDGNTAIVGGSRNDNNTGAAWTFTRANGVWSQQGSKFIGAPVENASSQGAAVAISADAGTVLVGGPLVNAGAAWAFTASPAAGTPAAAGVAPVAGSGATGTFTFTFSHSGGWQNLTVLDVLINYALDGRRACYLAFLPTDAGSGKLYLVDDSGHVEGPYSAMTLPGAGSVQNSQCMIAGAGSSASAAGNTLTLALAITFTSGFAGNQVFYVAARDPSATSGWQALGTWSVPGAPVAGPSVGGMSPARVSEASQTYAFTLRDGNGWQDISVVNVLVNSAIDGRRACYLAFVPSSMSGGSLFLVNDAGDAAGPYSTLTLPGSGAVNNSQCAVAAAGSTVSGSGNTLTLTLPIAFNHSFAGNRIFYLAARNNTLNSGWQAAGTVTVP